MASREELQHADSTLRSYLAKGLSYNQAAKKVSEQTRIYVNSLRWRAYHIAVKEGYFCPTNLQHNTRTTHGQLLVDCNGKLKDDGYTIIQEQNEIRKFMESKGSKGNPDLIALKGDEILPVEVVERDKERLTFVDQLERYTKVGKVIVLLSINTSNIVVWGTQSLVTN